MILYSAGAALAAFCGAEMVSCNTQDMATSLLQLQTKAGEIMTHNMQFGDGEPEDDYSDPDYAAFLQETKRGAKTHKRYDETVERVSEERDIDIDIHSGFRDLESNDIADEKELRS